MVLKVKLSETSPKLSLKGYKLLTWLKKNKDSIKQLSSVLLGLLAASFPNDVWVQGLFGVGTGVLTRLLLDLLDFYLSDVDLTD